MSIAFLNNAFVPLEAASISPLDRGFLFGDGVYEVIPVYQGRCFGLHAHMLRLKQSLESIQLHSPLSDEAWEGIFARLIEENGPDQCLYLQITRGCAPKRTHQFPATTQPTVFAMSLGAVQVVTEGIDAITVTDDRWKHCAIKSINLLANVLARETAEQAGSQEAIFIRNGAVTEGSSSNVFIVKNGRIASHPNEAGILPGTTRQLVLKLAAQAQIPFDERPISEQELIHADEVWVTSVGREITPVVRMNGKNIGTGSPGPIWRVLYDAYQQEKSHPTHH